MIANAGYSVIAQQISHVWSQHETLSVPYATLRIDGAFDARAQYATKNSVGISNLCTGDKVCMKKMSLVTDY